MGCRASARASPAAVAAATRRRAGGDGKPGNLAESVVNAAMRYRSQIPFVDNLLKEVGMAPDNLSDLGDLSVRLPGDKPPASSDGRR